MDQVVIHIGMHKSGSTFLQKKLFPSMDVVFQPLTPKTCDTSALPRRMVWPVELLQSASPIEPVVARRMMRIDSETDKSLVVSHEGLSGHPHGYCLVDPYAVLRNLKSVFPSAKVLIVIRRQADYLASLYSFRVAVRGLEHRSFSAFLKEELRAGLAAALRYDELISAYAKAFGSENVLVLPLEMLVDEPKEFVGRIEEFMGVRAGDVKGMSRSNESTRILAIINFWRGMNFLMKLILSALLLVTARSPSLMDTRLHVSFPFFRFRQWYFNLKRRITSRLNRILGSLDKLSNVEIEAAQDFDCGFAESNKKLHDSGLIRWSLSQYKYPL